MGPPSRYALRLAARDQTEAAATQTLVHHIQPERPRIPIGIDTSSMTNTEWAKYHLTQLTTATSGDEFAARGCAFLARQVNITMNGVHVSPALYAEQWGAAVGLKGSISFAGVVETPQVRIPMTQVRVGFNCLKRV